MVARSLDRIGFGYEKNEKYKPFIMRKLSGPPRSVGAAIAHRFNETADYIEMDLSDISIAMENIQVVSPVYEQAGLN